MKPYESFRLLVLVMGVGPVLAPIWAGRFSYGSDGERFIWLHASVGYRAGRKRPASP